MNTKMATKINLLNYIKSFSMPDFPNLKIFSKTFFSDIFLHYNMRHDKYSLLYGDIDGLRKLNDTIGFDNADIDSRTRCIMDENHDFFRGNPSCLCIIRGNSKSCEHRVMSFLASPYDENIRYRFHFSGLKRYPDGSHYLEIGLVVIMAIVLAAFEKKSYDKEQIEVVQRTAMDEVEDVIIQTQQEELPPPPPPEQPEVVTELNVIEDDAESKNEVDMSSFQRQEEATNIEITPVKIEEEEEEDEQEIFQVVEQDPEFPGGIEALMKYLQQNIKYPQLARENNITGRVYVTFVVEKDGSVTGVRVLRDIGGGCGQEAIRVVKSMPKWTPGKQRGKNVRVQYNLPVNFSLR